MLDSSFIPIDSLIPLRFCAIPKEPKNAKGLRGSLVCMPWGSVGLPSIAMGLLKECMNAVGCSTDLHFLYVDLAKQIGLETYNLIANNCFECAEWFFLNELFASAGDGEIDNSWSSLSWRLEANELHARLLGMTNNSSELSVTIAEEEVPRYIQTRMEKVDWIQYDLVVFTTTFAQSLSSLLLAKTIKAVAQNMAIVLGGANVTADVGVQLLDACEWVDYVVHGEAESYPTLLKNIDMGAPQSPVAGISMRTGGQVIRRDEETRPKIDLNAPPIPDYSDYLSALSDNGLKNQITVSLFSESQRGCWCGRKHHCTFSGPNGDSMGYHRKRADKVYSEILELSDRYRCMNILPNQYFRELLPLLPG